MNVFRVIFYIEDKNLGEAFKRLTGLARNIDYAFVPNLDDAAPEQPALKTKHKPNGGALIVTGDDAVSLFIRELEKLENKTFKARLAREAASAIGFSPTSYSYLLNKAVAAGYLERGSGRGTATTYTLINQGEPQ